MEVTIDKIQGRIANCMLVTYENDSCPIGTKVCGHGDIGATLIRKNKCDFFDGLVGPNKIKCKLPNTYKFMLEEES